MKIRIDIIFFFIFIISILVDGIIAEGIVCICLLTIFFLNKKKNKVIIGNQLYNKSLLFIIFYLLLFVIHICIGDCSNLVRFYGLTKCICTPALVLLVFPNIGREKMAFKSIIIMTLIFVIIYGISGLKKGVVLEDISYQFGSYNGCSGIAVILFPIVIFYRRYLINYNTFDKYLMLLYVISVFFIVVVSESLTTNMILILQVIVLLLITGRLKALMIKYSKKLCLCSLFILALISIFIGSKTIELDPMALRTRAGIWMKAYNTFVSQDFFSVFFGNSDCWVQMESKVLQAHNVFWEILLIYGIVGFLFFITSCVWFIKNIFSRLRCDKAKILSLSLISYFLFCFLHPFYTGVFVFQFICIFSMLFLILQKHYNRL